MASKNSELVFLAGLILVGLAGAAIGYTIGAPNKEDAERIKQRNERVNTLKSYKLNIPVAALRRTKNGHSIYAEAISCYLSGAPNGSFDNSMKVMEITLRKKYQEVEGKEVPAKWKLYNLIEWGDRFLRGNKVIAHNFRIQRKLIHYDSTTAETSSLNALIHISNLLNTLYPYDTTVCYYNCGTCNKLESAYVSRDQYFFGNSIQVRCASNSKVFFSVLINQ